MEKIKVVWICHFSNPVVSSFLPIRVPFLQRLIRKIMHHPYPMQTCDYAKWNSNAIREFEKINSIDLYIIAPYDMLDDKIVKFDLNGIHYTFFNNQDSSSISFIWRNIYKNYRCHYKRNRKIIIKIIKEIKPSIVHIIGAENLQYSLSILDLPANITSIIQLQTLASDPKIGIEYYSNDKKSYDYLVQHECKVLNKADYIGTVTLYFHSMIQKSIKQDAKFLNINLALAEDLDISISKKEFDFVYFAANINKAIDLALEAFILIHKKYPYITLDIIGDCDVSLRSSLDEQIYKLGLNNNIFFEGKLQYHDDVIKQIRKSRYALLPIKTDIVSGTIREAMANGLPVVTTITSGTPFLNSKYECVLLSQIGDHQAMADNMQKLILDDKFADVIRENAAKYAAEMTDNFEIMCKWEKAYKAIINNIKDGEPIPDIFNY